MWRSSITAVVNCIRIIMRCGGSNLDVDDLDDISEYDIQDVPVHFQPQTFRVPVQQRPEDFQHRPDAPGVRRRSPPEIVSRMLQAIEEMSDAKSMEIAEKAQGDHQIPVGSSFKSDDESMDKS